jgi:hypothetical protein
MYVYIYIYIYVCVCVYCGVNLNPATGTGGDYVDQDDAAPPWAQMADVQRLKAFWREQHAIATGQVTNLRTVWGV